jgi:Zn-dependent peptidase ImmA (M78 family)
LRSAPEANLFHSRPESAGEIIQLAQKTLLRADCLGKLPTPLDELYRNARVSAIELPSTAQMPLLRLEQKSRNLLRNALQKVRGIADLRRRAVYLPTGHSATRHQFAKAHELGHQLIPWHRVGRDCVDTDASLSPAVRDVFEAEANLFASEVMFQGKLFRTKARDYKPTFEAVFLLADQHGASRQATLWKFTEEQDFPVASLAYYPVGWGNDMKLWKVVASPSFRVKHCDIRLPERLEMEHPWLSAKIQNSLCEGKIRVPKSSGRQVGFRWHSWWNGHALVVLLRARPIFAC